MKGEQSMKKIIIYFIVGLLIFVLTVLKWHNAYAQKDSIIYQEEPIENSDYKPKVFSWSWNNNKNHVIVIPENPELNVLPRFIPDIEFYFDSKEFDRRMQKLESEMDKIRLYFRNDIRRELDRIKIDSLFNDSSLTKIILKKPHKQREIIVIPYYHYDTPKNHSYRYEKKTKITKQSHKNRQKHYNEKQDKKYIQELENKVKQLEKRLDEIEKNNKQK